MALYTSIKSSSNLLQASRKCAILVAHHVMRWIPWLISKAAMQLSNSSLLLLLKLKCFTTGFKLSYNVLTSLTLIVSERAIHFQQPSTECAEQKSGHNKPYSSAPTLAALTLTDAPSPQFAMGNLSDIAIWISL